MNRKAKLVLFGIIVGFVGMLFSVGLSLGLTLVAKPSNDVLTAFWENKLQLIPIVVGFGVQVGMYAVLRKGMHMPFLGRAGGVTTATGGGASTLAMIACCAPSGINLLLPLLGFTAIGTLLASWQMPFMIASVAVNSIGVAVMLYAFAKARRGGNGPVVSTAP